VIPLVEVEITGAVVEVEDDDDGGLDVEDVGGAVEVEVDEVGGAVEVEVEVDVGGLEVELDDGGGAVEVEDGGCTVELEDGGAVGEVVLVDVDDVTEPGFTVVVVDPGAPPPPVVPEAVTPEYVVEMVTGGRVSAALAISTVASHVGQSDG